MLSLFNFNKEQSDWYDNFFLSFSMYEKSLCYGRSSKSTAWRAAPWISCCMRHSCIANFQLHAVTCWRVAHRCFQATPTQTFLFKKSSSQNSTKFSSTTLEPQFVPSKSTDVSPITQIRAATIQVIDITCGIFNHLGKATTTTLESLGKGCSVVSKWTVFVALEETDLFRGLLLKSMTLIKVHKKRFLIQYFVGKST